MSTFQKYTGTNIMQINQDAKSGMLDTSAFGVLPTRQVFFGLQDIDGNFNNKLGNDTFSLTCDTSGCSARVSDAASSEDKTTGRSIYYNISETTSSRLITFKYNGNILFQVQQTVTVYERKADIMFVYNMQNSSKMIYGAYLVKNYFYKNNSPVGNTIVVDMVIRYTSSETVVSLTMNIGESSSKYQTRTYDIPNAGVVYFPSDSIIYNKDGWTYNITIQ